jgi:high-affinity Fe2+/Pb2+ permease
MSYLRTESLKGVLLGLILGAILSFALTYYFSFLEVSETVCDRRFQHRSFIINEE